MVVFLHFLSSENRTKVVINRVSYPLKKKCFEKTIYYCILLGNKLNFTYDLLEANVVVAYNGAHVV